MTGHYLPPNFRAEFLWGRGSNFFGSYGRAFYAHIAGGLPALLPALLLLSDAFRRKHPRGHRILGRIHTANLVLVVAPSGL